jgi:hypothetical protein
MSAWPFADPPDLFVLTTQPVLDGAPIRVVSHDEDDGGWQFLCGTTLEAADGRVVHLDHMLDTSPALATMADLPLGWTASWCDDHQDWHRQPDSWRARIRGWLRRG